MKRPFATQPYGAITERQGAFELYFADPSQRGAIYIQFDTYREADAALELFMKARTVRWADK